MTRGASIWPSSFSFQASWSWPAAEEPLLSAVVMAEESEAVLLLGLSFLVGVLSAGDGGAGQSEGEGGGCGHGCGTEVTRDTPFPNVAGLR